MAATANNNLSPSSPTSSISLTRTESPPWTQIVPSSPSPSPSLSSRSAENSENFDNVIGKKAVWNKKPANGAGPAENGVGPGPGLGLGLAEAWPALSECTSKASPQGTGIESSSLSIASPVHSESQSSPMSQKPTTSNLNHSPSNHGRPTRQKSMKRDGRDNPQANSVFSHQPLSPAEGSHNRDHSSTKPTTAGGSEISGRDSSQNHGHRDSGPRNGNGVHHQPRHSFTRGNGGSHSREGSHQNYVGRRGDQDRGNQDWNRQRSFNGRNATVQPRVSPRGFRSPSVSAPFVHPMPMQPTFMNPMGVAEVPMFYLPAFVAPVPGPVYIHPAPDPELYFKIVNQIDYYFSNENLIKDVYLRQNMDEHGWVRVGLIAKFKKVMQLTGNSQQILDALRSSTVVEVQGDKIRKRGDWVRWKMPPSVQFPTASSSQSPKSPTIDTLAARIQNVKVDEKTTDRNHSKDQLDVDETTTSRSGVLNSPVQAVTDGASSIGC